MEHIIIDASNRPLGRVASEAAVLLRGKNDPSFQRHRQPKNKIKVVNARQIVLTGNKRMNKAYFTHSGYPGNGKFQTLDAVIDKKGMSEVLRKAIYGMLPNNKLRSIMMNNLNITE